jgi:hypothetical protein
MGFKDKAISVGKRALDGGAASAFFGVFQGRCTFAAIAFSIVGVYGWLKLNRDLTSFALFAGAIQALLVARSGLQDYHERQTQDQQQNTTIVNNIDIPQK